MIQLFFFSGGVRPSSFRREGDTAGWEQGRPSRANRDVRFSGSEAAPVISRCSGGGQSVDQRLRVECKVAHVHLYGIELP